jgi:hypothetical protein
VDPAPYSVDADLILIARRVVEVLREEEEPVSRGLLKTEEAARLLGVDAEWVRANRVALGAVKLGDGPKPRLRFPREAIDAYLTARKVGAVVSFEEQPMSRPKASCRSGGSTPSLPATGQAVIEW